VNSPKDFFQSNRTQGVRSQRKRRAAGVSRRQRHRQRQFHLGFETLEDRRVMSAGSVLPSDPLFDQQFFLLNVGQQVGTSGLQPINGAAGEDINLLGARELGFTGQGVRVAILDTGVQLDHPDLNVSLENTQFDVFEQDFNASPFLVPFDPENPVAFFNPLNAQGTAVAGIIAAQDNGIGTVGIAPNAELVPVRLIDTTLPQTSQNLIDAVRFVANNNVDIANISFGDSAFGGVLGGARQINSLTPGELLALSDATIGPNPGRNGLGTIFVVPAGNDASLLGSSNYDGLVNSRFTIAVTGVDDNGQFNNDDGTVTDYPEAGASVLVAAFVGSNAQQIGDDPGIGSGILTTDTTGSTGFNVPPDPFNGQEFDRDFQPNENITSLFGTSQFGGTTAAAAQVSGVVALMLEANPNLSYRDVQEILVRSARHPSANTTQANGLDIALGFTPTQNPQIVNQIPLYHDPDAFDPLIPNALQIFRPTADPRLAFPATATYAPSPEKLTNGAGFVVSHGRGNNGQETGLGFGIVDAELAVRLASQWTAQNQSLADEISFTTTLEFPGNSGVANNIPAAFIQTDLDIIVPGGLGGGDGFGAFFDEYFEDVPDFTQGFAPRGTPLELTVPQVNGNDIIVESVDVVLDIAGGDAEALDHLRIVLVSPNGTQSELNHAFLDPGIENGGDNPPNTAQGLGVRVNGLDGFSNNDVDPGSVGAGGNLIYTANTVRNRGERSDDAIVFNPLTNEPYVTLPSGPVLPGLPVPQPGGNRFNFVPSSVGDLVSQGWQLHFENHGPTAFTLNSVELVWHGQPVGAATERVQGKVGIDDNQDDLFNFSRVIQNVVNIDGDPSVTRLGEVTNLIDPNQEGFASNVTVLAYQDVDPTDGDFDEEIDILVDQYITGADGNYFFDLVPGDYFITTNSDLAVEDELTPSGLLQGYRREWQITEDFFRVIDFDANLEVPTTLDANNVATPSAFLDGSLNEVVTGIRNLNFLIDPGTPAAPEIEVGGTIFADFDGNGAFDNGDINLPNITVFADTNRNGQFDPGEVVGETDGSGNYLLTVPQESASIVNVGVIEPIDWTVVAPAADTSFTANGIASPLVFDNADSTFTFFTEPGDALGNVNFSIQPPLLSSGGGTINTGILLGNVFNDIDVDSTEDANEPGLAGITVFIDSNSSGAFEPGELTATTNANGAFVFTDVSAGQIPLFLDLSSNPSLTQTSPGTNFPPAPVIPFPHVANLSGGGTVTGLSFGVSNSAVLDFGDLPAAYGLTLLSEDGARNQSGIYFLGSRIDTELDGQPSDSAAGDNITLDDDEDGIIVQGLRAGAQSPDAQGQLTAIASRFGSNINAWVDFNADFDFDDPGEQILTNFSPVAGPNVINFELPDFIAADGVFARFRYGSFDIGLTGFDPIGETEDYQLAILPPPPVTNQGPADPDLNQDGAVNGADFLAWQRGFDSGGASSSNLAAWHQEFGSETLPLAAATVEEGNSLAAIQVDPQALAMQQPGFREDLVVSTLDTRVASGIVSTVQLLAAASAPVLRSDIVTEESSAENGVPQVAQQLALLDQAFSTGQELSVASALSQLAEGDEDEALAVALGEEIDWRLN